MIRLWFLTIISLFVSLKSLDMVLALRTTGSVPYCLTEALHFSAPAVGTLGDPAGEMGIDAIEVFAGNERGNQWKSMEILQTIA